MLHLMMVEYTDSAEAAEPFVAAHVEYLERRHREGTFLVSGQTVPAERGGAIVACGVDRATAERIAAEDPFVVAGVARYEITTIDPGRVHPALAGVPGMDASRVRG
ncbi:YciI family protein [Streptomyces macrosporus]|uniref:YCII-related domain-containing protein n=1 Tax=Streptomyces macrosporus TaxID=44032 RepID=A0ABP5WPT7_9ACTN